MTYSNVLFSLLSCLRKRENHSSFLENGSILLEELIASSDGKYNPVRNYSADELMTATNDFDPSKIMEQDASHKSFQGFLDNRSVIIKIYFTRASGFDVEETRSMAIRDIVISIQMSNHRNALMLLGCCLELPLPALVFEYAAKGALNMNGGYGVDESLPWKNRLRIAKQLANAITYLHTAFPRPIIHRDLKSKCIFLDDDYVPKLSNFSLAITIPPEQFQVQDDPRGTVGYLDPEYYRSGCISEKTDVYSFGVILLMFFTGRRAYEEDGLLVSYVKLHARDGQIMSIVDPKILEELHGEDGQAKRQQLHDFLSLALSCVQDEYEVRPEMINVAKELVRMEKSISPL